MSKKKELILKFDPDGTMTAIYDDDFAEYFASLGKVTITRASFVEPDADGKWVADMSPVGGPKLAPCTLRSEALEAERAWLEKNIF